MECEELGAWLRLTHSPGVGNAAARRLLTRFGSPQTIFSQTQAALEQCVQPSQATALRRPPDHYEALLKSTEAWLAGSDRTAVLRAVVPLGHPLYPQALLEIADPPLLLYFMGAARFFHAPTGALQRETSLAMVGSRNPTPQGRDTTLQFARALRESGLCIVSGLALGVDAAAHEGALAAELEAMNPATIAVVGTGLDRVYPARHLDLAHRIAAQGLLVSEYALGTPPLAANFPRRNRIISGLSQGVLVVEAAPASGSLITARMAVEQGREVFAIPGSIHAIQSRGCHALIKQGAKLVETVADVLEELPPLPDARSTRIQPEANAESEPADSALLQALGFDPMGLDALQARTGMDTASLQVQLLELELAGVIARLPGGYYQRLGRA